MLIHLFTRPFLGFCDTGRLCQELKMIRIGPSPPLWCSQPRIDASLHAWPHTPTHPMALIHCDALYHWSIFFKKVCVLCMHTNTYTYIPKCTIIKVHIIVNVCTVPIFHVVSYIPSPFEPVQQLEGSSHSAPESTNHECSQLGGDVPLAWVPCACSAFSLFLYGPSLCRWCIMVNSFDP